MTEQELEIFELRQALADAERVMRRVDKAVGEHRLDPRSGIADARLDYSEPFKSRLAKIRPTTSTRKPDGSEAG